MKIFRKPAVKLLQDHTRQELFTERMIRRAGGLPMSRTLYEQIMNDRIDEHGNLIRFNPETTENIRNV